MEIFYDSLEYINIGALATVLLSSEQRENIKQSAMLDEQCQYL
jgi:hypothetical protein